MLGSDERPLRVAVVGSGPSGFYATEALFKAEPKVRVDMFDRLVAPFGLVRYGVAPDHDKIKSVIKVYERIASAPEFELYGNVLVGRDITVAELSQHYDAVIFANGAQTDRRLGIPGEDLPGSYTATEFVAWYNGHPEYVNHSFDLSHEVAVVIGQGNVAVDVCRILCKTVDELKHTDIAAYALDALAESRVKEIHMVGRRGPVQAAFTPQEMKEFGELQDCDPVVDPDNLNLGAVDEAERDLPKNSKARKNLGVLEDLASRGESEKSRRFVVQFLASPKELLGSERLERVVFERNRLEGEPGRQRARGTGETFEMNCGALFRSVGYRGVPIEGVPFNNDWGVFANEEGRITDSEGAVPGLYAVGWIKRGPSGIIGTNKPDAIATVKNLLADLPQLEACAKPDSGAVRALLAGRGVRAITYDDWKKIDAAEIALGEAVGKPREKFCSVEDALRGAGLNA